DKLRHDTKYAFSDLMDYITGKDHDGSLKEGKLYEVDDRVIKNRHYITMETTTSSTNEPIRLKGYTATIYKNNSWNQTDAYEKYQTMFDEFAKSAYMMGDATGRLITSNPKFAGDFFTDITLSNFRRKKPYAYGTYFASFTGDYTSVYDTYAAPPDNDRYTYPAYLFENYLYMVPDSAMYKTADYQAAFVKYKDFVNEEYIKSQIPESVRALAMSFEASDKFEYINAMRPFLQQNMEHTWESGKCPKDADFVENFLFNTKAGYSTHFATAAAVLLQARGYPTRYVEGYYIPADVFNSTESERVEDYKTVDITDAYAHAWVEVFDDTYGWMPVEVTPGYWKGNISAPRPPEPEEPEPETPENSGEKLPTDFEIVDDEVENEVADEPFEPKSMRWPWEVVPLALVAVILAFCVRLLAFAVSKRRIYRSRDVGKKLRFAYKWLVSLAAYQKIPVGNVYDHAKLAERMSGVGRHITAEAAERILNVLLKHAYSRTPATLEEANEVLSGLRDYSRAIYASLSKPKKWAYRHLRNLY
ncbi:MAG: transglutaminase domain-containing protein, partial [Clostridia bacterium]|nr:transglutaminase domain-containing protein [Clostridia bacterium]